MSTLITLFGFFLIGKHLMFSPSPFHGIWWWLDMVVGFVMGLVLCCRLLASEPNSVAEEPFVKLCRYTWEGIKALWK